MKTMIPFAFLALIFIIHIEGIHAQSNDSILIPQGTSILLDGVISGAEWNDAAVTSITDGDFMYKHDNSFLYVAFTNTLYHASTGIYIDKNYDSGSSPQTDDIWLHGSAGQYEFVGTGIGWQLLTPLDWAFVTGTSSEYMIPLSKLSITSSGTYEFGILFSLRDWSINQTDEITWPAGGFPNCGNPDTWAKASLILNVAVNEYKNEDKEITLFPNPASNFITIKFSNDEKENHSIIIYNAMGQKLRLIENITDNQLQIDCSHLPCGMYLFELKNKNNTSTVYKFMLE